MMYEFQEVGGTARIERNFPMSEAPELGSIHEFDGKKYIRVVSAPVLDKERMASNDKYPLEDITLPKGTDAGNGLGKTGCPMFRNIREHKEFGRRHGLVYD